MKKSLIAFVPILIVLWFNPAQAAQEDNWKIPDHYFSEKTIRSNEKELDELFRVVKQGKILDVYRKCLSEKAAFSPLWDDLNKLLILKRITLEERVALADELKHIARQSPEMWKETRDWVCGCGRRGCNSDCSGYLWNVRPLIRELAWDYFRGYASERGIELPDYDPLSPNYSAQASAIVGMFNDADNKRYKIYRWKKDGENGHSSRVLPKGITEKDLEKYEKYPVIHPKDRVGNKQSNLAPPAAIDADPKKKMPKKQMKSEPSEGTNTNLVPWILGILALLSAVMVSVVVIRRRGR